MIYMIGFSFHLGFDLKGHDYHSLINCIEIENVNWDLTF